MLKWSTGNITFGEHPLALGQAPNAANRHNFSRGSDKYLKSRAPAIPGE